MKLKVLNTLKDKKSNTNALKLWIMNILFIIYSCLAKRNSHTHTAKKLTKYVVLIILFLFNSE